MRLERNSRNDSKERRLIDPYHRSAGIGIACIVAQHFDVPVVFAKKAKSINLEGEMYVAEVESFTHNCKNQVIVAQKFLGEKDHVLIIDDFLANGCALQGLIQIVQSAEATVEGIGIVVEKGFQPGEDHPKSGNPAGIAGYRGTYGFFDRRDCIQSARRLERRWKRQS